MTWLHAGEAGVYHGMWIGLGETSMESDDAGRYLKGYSRPRATIEPLLQRVGKFPDLVSVTCRGSVVDKCTTQK